MGHAYSRGHFIGQEFVYFSVNKMSHQVFYFGQFLSVHTICAPFLLWSKVWFTMGFGWSTVQAFLWRIAFCCCSLKFWLFCCIIHKSHHSCLCLLKKLDTSLCIPMHSELFRVNVFKNVSALIVWSHLRWLTNSLPVGN